MEWHYLWRLIHLLAASVWTGGLLVLAALVLALRRAGAERDLLRAAARQFARVSWAAMLLAITSGIAQVELLNFPWSYGRLQLKIALVTLVILLTLGHQLSARRTSPALRGLVQLVLILLSLGIYAAASSLRGF